MFFSILVFFSSPQHPWLCFGLSCGTSCQARFTEALLHNAAHLPLPPDRIFSTAETGQPKSEVLAQLQAAHPGAACHFVEDKLSTLEKVGRPTLALLVSYPARCGSKLRLLCRSLKLRSLTSGRCIWLIGATTQRRSGHAPRPTPGLRWSTRQAWLRAHAEQSRISHA